MCQRTGGRNIRKKTPLIALVERRRYEHIRNIRLYIYRILRRLFDKRKLPGKTARNKRSGKTSDAFTVGVASRLKKGFCFPFAWNFQALVKLVVLSCGSIAMVKNLRSLAWWKGRWCFFALETFGVSANAAVWVFILGLFSWTGLCVVKNTWDVLI